MEYYSVDIMGRVEKLPILTLPSGINIAFFNLHGNPELTEFCGKEIAKFLHKFNIEVLITAESKGLQLTHVVARELGHEFYAVCRKQKKIYMPDCIEANVKAITGEVSHSLYLVKSDADKLFSKRVAIVDDVISTGGSLKGLKELVLKAGGMLVASACVLAEGDSITNPEILRLANIPLL